MGLFQYGAEWLRVDFHLHTRADKKFHFDGESNFYYSEYITALKKAGIVLGMVTNHNKFDFDEFKALKKVAKKEGIVLLPGAEIHLNDASNGVHVLVVFSDEWVKNSEDRISPFISSLFLGKEKSQVENAQSSKSIEKMVNDLDETGLDYFLVFAHVEDTKGLWHQASGGRFRPWRESAYQPVRDRTLAFQKVTSRELRANVINWLGGWYPAEVEGSDPENMEQIGRHRPCFFKLGALTYDAVKFALRAHQERLCLDEVPIITHSHIQRVHFEGGTLDRQTICFSPELNTLIGIRGSGKSSVLEAMRYALGIPVDENDSEKKYKRELVERTFGSGGKVMIDAVDCHGQSYQIRRIFNDAPGVYLDDKIQAGITIRETVLNKPLYFGQKELAAAGDGAEKDLIEKLLGDKCIEIRRQIHEQNMNVMDIIDKLSRKQNVDDQISEQENIIKDAAFRLNFYKEHHLEEKMEKRLGFDKDISKVEEGIGLIEAFYTDVMDLLANHEDELRNFPGYLSKTNPDFIRRYDELFSQSIRSIDVIKAELIKMQSTLGKLKKEQGALFAAKSNLTEEFAAVERLLAEELKSLSGQRISTTDFLNVKRELATAQAKLATLKKSGTLQGKLEVDLNKELSKLKGLWHEEFRIIKKELLDVSLKNTALHFSVEYRGDKDAFLEYFSTVLGGNNLRKSSLKKTVDEYPDFHEVYADLQRAKQNYGSNAEKFASLFSERLKDLLTYQTPNKYTIRYHNVELEHHSLGQRASALILFVLGQRRNDVIIIDQPEDDLDSKTIYEDVISLIRELKPSVQFIFATHNPNITVLGDAEQIHACSLADGKIAIESGALDNPKQQERIVNIMEGGQEAFERRKEIYKEWKP